MADPVQEILSVRSYKGDSTAGGSQTFGVTIDATPFDKLAQFTYYQNKELWERKNQKDDANAIEMAKMMALDINSAFPEFYDHLNKQKQEIAKMLEDPSVLDYQKNPEGYKKVYQAYGKLAADKNRAVANDLKLNSELARIQALPAQEQAAARQILENNKKALLADGAESALTKSPILATGATFTPDIFTPPKVGNITYKTAVVMGDNNKEFELTVPDGNGLWASSGRLALGIEQTAEFKPLPNPTNDKNIALQNENAKVQFETNKIIGNNPYSGQTIETFNRVIPTYFQQQQLYDSLPDDQKGFQSPPQKPEIVTAVEALNQNIDVAEKLLQKQALRGGKPYVPTLRKINIQDGIDMQEFIYLNSLSQDPQFIKYEERLTNTDNAFKYTKLAIDDANADADRNAENERARLAANAKALSGGKSSPVLEADFSPLQSIAAGAGALNKSVPVTSLSIAQIAAIKPTWLDEKGNITEEAKGRKITVGTLADGGYGVFILGENDKTTDRAVEAISESQLLSNGAGYLATFAKERKGQDAYAFRQQDFSKAIGKKITIPSTTSDNTQNVDEFGVPIP